jgi:hypothetical protein
MACRGLKTFVLVIATVPLYSCFPVEDFGAYWDKGGTDKRLAGSWKEIAASPEPVGFGPFIRFVERAGAYEISTQDGEMGYPIRTLNVGRYQFLAMGPKKGRLQRYKVNTRVLDLCYSSDLVEEFVKANYPHAVNFKPTASEGDYLEIGVFDDEVFTILSKIPDTKPIGFVTRSTRKFPKDSCCVGFGFYHHSPLGGPVGYSGVVAQSLRVACRLRHPIRPGKRADRKPLPRLHVCRPPHVIKM